jgi:hypothetical protein
MNHECGGLAVSVVKLEETDDPGVGDFEDDLAAHVFSFAQDCDVVRIASQTAGRQDHL